MAHKNHYAHCGYCGWTGKEAELPPDPNHECGKDECPSCNRHGFITCCYKSFEDAEIEGWSDINMAPQENVEESKTQQATAAGTPLSSDKPACLGVSTCGGCDPSCPAA